MKKYLMIALLAIITSGVFAQEGPKEAKKDVKSDKKEAKMTKKKISWR